MAGPLTIQRFPRGLLDLLGMKGTGQAPTSLAELLAGTIDATQFYLFERITTTTKFLANSAIGGYRTDATLTVPAGELWIFDTASYFIAVSAAGSIRLTPAYQRAVSTGDWSGLGVQTQQVGGAAATDQLISGQLGRELILSPSDTIGAYINAPIVGTYSLFMRMDYYRLTF